MSVHSDQALPPAYLDPVQEDVPPGGHFVTDSHGVIQSADHVAATMMKLSQRDLAGQVLSDVLAPDDRAILHTHLRKIESGELGLEWEMTLAPGGRSFSALLTLAALREPSGRIASLHWVIRDTSAWKRWAVSDRVLHTMSEHLRNGCSLRHVLSRLCEQLIQLLPYPLIQVAMREAGDIVLCAQAGASRMNGDQPRCEWTSDERCRLESVLDTRATFHLQEPPGPADRTTAEGGRYPSRLLVPFGASDGAVGVLVIHGMHHETFDLRTIQWFENVARQVTYYVTVHQDRMIREEREARISHLAHHDSLTDLPNRILFNDRLNQALAQARRHDRGVGVLFVDLDHFKAINDSLGHEAGDALLKIVADRLTRCVRATDTVARLSGDEFTVLLQDVHRTQDAWHVAHNVLDAIMQPAILGSQSVTIGIR